MARVIVINEVEDPSDTKAEGYDRNGTSVYSRAACHGQGAGAGIPAEQLEGWRSRAQLIERNTKQLAKIEAELLSGKLSHERRAVLESNRKIKREFIQRLENESHSR